MYRKLQRHLKIRLAGSSVRFSSTAAPRKPSVKDLFKAPIVKSVFLTVLFGTAVVELIKQRRDLENLKLAHKSKFAIYEDVIAKLQRGEKVDLAHDLKIANTLTKNKYNDVSDIELDEQLGDLLSFVDEEEEEEVRSIPLKHSGDRSLLKFL